MISAPRRQEGRVEIDYYLYSILNYFFIPAIQKTENTDFTAVFPENENYLFMNF